MAATPSAMMPLGTKAPEFDLLEPLTGNWVSLDDVRGEHGTVVMFICNHCPFVIRLKETLSEFAAEYIAKGIGVVAINANDAEKYPEDGPEEMADDATNFDYPFNYLYDITQETAQAYNAVCTPDFFVFDNNDLCVYRGQFDSSRPGNDHPITGADIRAALDNLIAGSPISEDQTPSIGCNIKWKQ